MSLATPFFPFPRDVPLVMYRINKSNQSSTISTNFQNIVSVVSKLFRKPDAVTPPALFIPSAPPIFSNPTIIEKSNNINNVLSVIIKLFEKPQETIEPKRKWPNMLDFFKDGKKGRTAITYEPDYNAEKCMKLLEGNPLKELYEPISTYEDKSTGAGVCVFKLKSINKENEDKLSEDDKTKRSEAEETIKVRYKLEEA